MASNTTDQGATASGTAPARPGIQPKRSNSQLQEAGGKSGSGTAAAGNANAAAGNTSRPGSAASNSTTSSRENTTMLPPAKPNVAQREELKNVDEEDSDEEEETAPTPVKKGKKPERRASQSPTASDVGSPPKAPTPTPENQAQASGSGRPRTQNNVMDADLNEAQRRLLEELVDINGQDSYDALAAGVGKLKTNEYLVLPNGFQLRQTAPENVGKPAAHAHMNLRIWSQIYALNKAVAPEGADPKVFGLLRLEAVKCGWIEEQREIRFAAPPADAMRTLATDLTDLRERAGTIKTASFLIPLIAEHVFRTFGHHFISSDAANYTERYNATLRSCLAPDVIGLLPPPVMYHAALHWVSPGRAWRVLLAQLDTASIPDALRIRKSAAPAGTAILTTTAAIIDSMAAVGLDALFARHGSFDLDTIRQRTAEVKANPPKFHKTYFAYQIAGPTAAEVRALDEAKEIAIRFSPFAQAYINTYMRDAALGKAQALKKHAEQNPVQLRRAQNLFRAITRKDVTTVEELFSMHLARRDLDD